MIRARVLAAALWVALPVAASAQAGDWDARLDDATRAAVEATLSEAVRDSLPLGALRSKVLEGVAKAVPPERIGQVVADFADELRAARSMLRESLPGRPIEDGEVAAVAMATRQGLGPEVVRSLWASRPNGGSLEIPVTVLSELVRRGVSPGDASAVMAHVVRTAVPLHVAAQLPGKIDGALGAGVPPSAALGQALRTLNIPEPPGRRPNE